MGNASKVVSILALALSAAWASTTLAQNPPGPPDGLAVRIMNTPVPVTGSLGITGNVNAVQSGPWSVNAVQSGTWNVNATINNTQTNPVKTINQSQIAANMVELSCFTHRGGSPSDICIKIDPRGFNVGAFTVPAGQVLIVTQLDFTIDPVPELTRQLIEISLGHDTPAGIAAGRSVTNLWILPTPAAGAANVWQQRTFNPGFQIASGHQIYYAADTQTGLRIYGYLTPAN